VKLRQTTPRSVTKKVRQFLADAQLSGKPRFLAFSLASAAYRANYCLDNCKRDAERSGDLIQFGWTIWQDEDAEFIEAEFHAVMRRTTGLHDITPRRDAETNILFVPDAARVPVFVPPAAWRTWTNIKSLNGHIHEHAQSILLVDAPASASALNQ
jgi:hypothetical protein